MSIRLRDTQLNILGELRDEPTAKRVRTLVPSETNSGCASRGEASYWSAQIGGKVLANISSNYPDPCTTPRRSAVS